MPHCSALSNHLCVSVDGNFRPCCRYDQETNNFSIKNYTFNEYKDTAFYKSIQDNMEKGWDPGCIKCKAEEDLGKYLSMRQRLNRDFSGNGIKFIEISISNKCNITCRMCGPKYSSKWAQIDNVEVEKQNYSTLLDSIDFSTVKRIKYLGGEPFITPEFKELIDRVTNKESVDLQVNTNATFFPNKYIDELAKFKNVYIALSIDGIGKVDEYVRQGTNWDKKLSVIKQWLDTNFILYIHTVVQAHNIHDLKNIKSFAEKNNLHWSPAVITHPKEFTLEALDKNYVSQIKDDTNKLFLNNISNYNKELNNKFKFTTKRLDALFGTTWESLVK